MTTPLTLSPADNAPRAPALVIYDLETTGTNPLTAGVVQLAALQVMSFNAPAVALNTLTNPGIAIQPEAIAVHGITQEMVRLMPSDTLACWYLQRYLGSINLRYDVVLAGHNIGHFDNRVVARLLGAPLPYPCVDTLTLARRLWPRAASHRLGDLVTALGLGSTEGAHTAIHDCFMVMRLVEHISILRQENILALAQWSMTPQIYEFMPLGKHKGVAFEYIPRSYIKFMITRFDTIHPDLAVSIEHHFPGMLCMRPDYEQLILRPRQAI